MQGGAFGREEGWSRCAKMSDHAGVAAIFLRLSWAWPGSLVMGYVRALCTLNVKSANLLKSFLFMFCQGDFHCLQPKELAFCDSHRHASQSQKVTLRPKIILYAYKEATTYHPMFLTINPHWGKSSLSLSLFFLPYPWNLFRSPNIKPSKHILKSVEWE